MEKLTDADILLFYLKKGLDNATEKEKPEIQAHIDILEFDQSEETINLCNQYREKIHCIIIGQRQLELPFNKKP